MNSRKNYWETVYQTKTREQVSWTQDIPQTSLDYIDSFKTDKSVKIIDIGGGDSKLVDFLLEQGFENISVLDISEKALERAKLRLGEKADKVNWIVCDITEFEPQTTFDIWHDRAAFHFLTDENQIKKYIDIAGKCVSGHLIIGTFSNNGPTKCSGLDIRQYSEETLTAVLENRFEKLYCTTEDHITPFETSQHFLFCSFRARRGAKDEL